MAMALNERDFGVLKILVHKRLLVFLLGGFGSLLCGVILVAALYFLLRWIVAALGGRVGVNLSGSLDVLVLTLIGLMFGCYFLIPKRKNATVAEEIPEPEFGFGVRNLLGVGNGQTGTGCLGIVLFGVRLFDIAISQLVCALRLQFIPISTIEMVIEPLLRRDSVTVEELSRQAQMSEKAVIRLLVLLDAVVWLHSSRKLAAALASTWSDPLLGIDEEE